MSATFGNGHIDSLAALVSAHGEQNAHTDLLKDTDSALTQIPEYYSPFSADTAARLINALDHDPRAKNQPTSSSSSSMLNKVVVPERFAINSRAKSQLFPKSALRRMSSQSSLLLYADSRSRRPPSTINMLDIRILRFACARVCQRRSAERARADFFIASEQ